MVGVCFGQDEYPYFSDPEMQTKFEDNRVYIIEKSGKELHYSGGESYTELANTWGYILLDESPEYVVKQTPLKTHYEYYYDFKIKKGTKILDELEFLLETGYDSKAKEVYNNYEKIMTPYRIKYSEYEKQFNYYLENNKTSIKSKNVYGECCLFPYFGLTFLVGALNGFSPFISIGSIGLIITGFIPSKENYTVDSITKPMPPSEPQLKQVLTNEQIKSLAESYNRRLYQKINKR